MTGFEYSSGGVREERWGVIECLSEAAFGAEIGEFDWCFGGENERFEFAVKCRLWSSEA